MNQYVTDHDFELVKLYPEGPAEARFKFRRKGILYSYCNKHGLNKFMLEAKEKWGATPQWKEFEEKTQKKSETEMSDMGAALMKLFSELGEIKDQDPSSDAAQAKVKSIQDFITKNYYTCTNEIFKSLSLMYVEDERFRENIDKAGGAGTAEFAKAAIDILTR